jgi:hypothetical protein
MTYQRRMALSDFTGGHSSPGKDRDKHAFRNFKNESSLTTYFRTAKELLAYYYRVVHREDGHSQSWLGNCSRVRRRLTIMVGEL